jgi:hypothetical protein
MNYEEFFTNILKGDGVRNLIKLDYWDGKTIKEPDSYKDISVCTTCMNRLGDLSKTLEQNIVDSLDYKGKVEFVLLDYNSQDGLGDWVKKNLMKYIESGVLVYYRTDEPKYYSMSHSRNVAFRLATGQIVNSVDSDNFVGKGFVDRINFLSFQQPSNAVFLKGRRMLRGRLGFYKNEFINDLGAYDEGNMNFYGAEDHDIMHRACGLGYKLMWFGGDFYKGLEDSKKHQTGNFKNKRWRYTENLNKLISFFNIYYKIYKANDGMPWGVATVTKNFSNEIITLG